MLKLIFLIFTSVHLFTALAVASNCPATLYRALMGEDLVPTLGPMRKVAKSIDESVDLLLDEAMSLQQEIREVFSNSKVDIHKTVFPRNLINRFNQNTKQFLKLLNENGVEARTLLTKSNPEFLQIDILGITENAPLPFKNYFKRFKELRGNELFVSNFDNAVNFTAGRYLPDHNSVDIGIESLGKALKGEEDYVPYHEMNHLKLTKMQDRETDQYSIIYYGGKNEDLLLEDGQSLRNIGYGNFMTSQEIYTNSRDLEFLGHQLLNAKTQKEKITLYNEIRNKINSFKELSFRTINLAQSNRQKSTEKIDMVNGRLTFIRTDSKTRPSILKLTQKETKIYNTVDEQELMELLNESQKASYQIRLAQIQNGPFISRRKTELIRETLRNYISDKYQSHTNELSFTVQSNIRKMRAVENELNSGNFNSKKISELLIAMAN